MSQVPAQEGRRRVYLDDSPVDATSIDVHAGASQLREERRASHGCMRDPVSSDAEWPEARFPGDEPVGLAIGQISPPVERGARPRRHRTGHMFVDELLESDRPTKWAV